MAKVESVSVVVDIPFDVKPGTVITRGDKLYEIRSIESIEFVTERIMMINGTARVSKLWTH